MENNLHIELFAHPQFGNINAVITEDGTPLFKANDVALALGYKRPAEAVSDHCKGVAVLPTPSAKGLQPTKYIKEYDVYRLVMRSKLPEAERFQDWVVEEVLPAIRKSGGYMVARKDESDIDILARAILIANDTIERQKIKLIELAKDNEAKEQQLQEEAPKVAFANAMLASNTSCLIGELAKITTQNGYPIGQNRLFAWMRDNGYLGNRGERRNIPNQQYVERGFFELKKNVHSGKDGVLHTTVTPKVTPSGQAYFLDKLLNQNNNNENNELEELAS